MSEAKHGSQKLHSATLRTSLPASSRRQDLQLTAGALIVAESIDARGEAASPQLPLATPAAVG
ncbi:MAG: hypothetical protein RL653_117 [Pseudomonadota bacterium]|jgi:hypothetical protein